MAKQAGSESKAPLIIILVIFILLSGGLGYTTYAGYEAKDAAEKDKKKAEEATKAKENEVDYYKFQSLDYRAYVGHPQAVSNESLVTLRGQYNNHNFDKVADPNKAETDTFIKEALEKKLGWNDAQKRPVKTYEGIIKELTAKVAEQDALIKKMEKDYKDLDDLKAAETTKLADAKKEYNKNLEDKDKLIRESEKQRREATLALLNDANESKKFADEARITLAKQLGELQKIAKESDGKSQMIAKLQEQIDALRDDVKVVKSGGTPDGGGQGLGPKRGEILRVDSTGERPFINLGSLDKLQPGQTFAVQRLDTDGRPTTGHRVSVAVLKVIGDHTAQVEVRDQDLAAFRKERSLNPLNPPLFLAGDALYNPSFNPDQPPRHAVLVGRVTAGRPDEALNRKLFENALKKQNIILDPALTRATDWLIVGESGTPEDERTINETEARAREMGLLRKDGKIVEMRLFLEKHGLTGLLPPPLPGASLIAAPRPPADKPADKPMPEK